MIRQIPLLLILLLFGGALLPAQQLRLTHPNGGNIYHAGDTIAITWTGPGPRQRLRIEYSVDAGGQWTTIADDTLASPWIWRIPQEIVAEEAMIRLWTRRDSAMLLDFQPSVISENSMSVSPDGRLLATATAMGRSELWNVETGERVRRLGDTDAWNCSARFSPDGSRVAVTAGSTLHVYDTAGGPPLYKREIGFGFFAVAEYSPDGSVIATGSFEGNTHPVRIWRASDGQLLHELDAGVDEIEFIAFTPDSRRVLIPAEGGSARLYDIITGDSILTVSGHTTAVRRAAISSDGARIVTSSENASALLHDAITGRLVAMLPHEKEVTSVGFSHDGMRVVTTSVDQTARIWNATDGSAIRTLNGHPRRATGAAFSPDDSRVLTWGYYDILTRLWQTETGAPLRALTAHYPAVCGALFTPDGRTIITCADAQIRIWPPNGGEIVTDQSDAPFLINAPILDVRSSEQRRSITLHPNPTSGDARLRIELATPRTVTITVTDITGRQMLPPIERSISGASIDIPSGSLAPGEYLVVVQIDGKRDVRKLVLLGE